MNEGDGQRPATHRLTNLEPPATRFGSADLQVHTSHGDGMSDARAIFDRVDALALLDVLAVTDHDDVRGALEAREVHARGNYRFEFVPGIEVTTTAGHLLALWVDVPVRSFRRLDQTIAAIHRAGGLAVIPHPMSYLTRSIGQRALERVLAQDDPETRPDGIEVANPTLAGRVTRAKVERLNRERYHLPETGGSDAHFIEEVGSAYTLFRRPEDGSSAAEALRRALEAGEVSAAFGRRVPLGQIGAKRLLTQQVRGLSVTPRKVLGPPLRRMLPAAGGKRS